ncbi:GNAT family N-acetyltransferase [Marinicella litoralis]|uniref:RimJ/RimL family protein N-acetyltransferase n=1 Tax=Marinicella litoralis TaxID=644220 RepID=A0A4R6XUM1_9GAMM|nr:GNAT family N-acetyltransferase [Marinicella litoralis]TDR23702.1 RimJ/RimL family protein N-acetyltransferase [Marinicella litoralis]
MSFVLTTDRLSLTELDSKDAAFIFDLFNDEDCIRFIGDRGIKTGSDASEYLQTRLIDSYQKNGFGLYKATLKTDDEPMGICGLVKRDEHNPPDIGFAFLPQFRSGGYCTEAAQAILNWARDQRISDEILAYTNPDNFASIRVLEKIGLLKQTITKLPGQDFESLILSIRFK